jgi:hypothetical protein
VLFRSKTYTFRYFTLQHQIFETLVDVDFNEQQVRPALPDLESRVP